MRWMCVVSAPRGRSDAAWMRGDGGDRKEALDGEGGTDWDGGGRVRGRWLGSQGEG